MPKEDRRILFSNDEVYKAVYALSVQKQLRKPPPGAVQSVDEKDGDSNTIVLKMENPGEGTKEEREYSRDFIAASLMVFCRGAGIPLPKSARKSVMVKDGDVILRVLIG